MITVGGRTFSVRATKPATAFTPIVVAVLGTLVNGIVIDWQQRSADFYWYVDIPLIVVMLVGIVDCLERLVSLGPTTARWARLTTLAVSTLVLASAFFGPLTLGIYRWAAIVVGVPCAVMAWLAVRELVRLLALRNARRAPPRQVAAAGGAAQM